MKGSVTYTFDENEVGYAIHNGKVIASHTDIDELEKLADIEVSQSAQKPKKASGRVIVNPSGLKGTVLGKTQGLFDEEVSVRFENGEIRRISAVFVEPDNSPVEKTAGTETSFIDGLNTRLASTYATSQSGLQERYQELTQLKREATTLLSGKPSFEEERELHSIVVAADNELDEIDQALDHYATEEANEFKAPAPFRLEAVEQAGVGTQDKSTWLDHAVQGMIDETKSEDYEKLLSEGPSLFVAEQPTGTLASVQSTQIVASSFIRSKIAMIQPEVADEYERVFLARAEEARKEEYKERTASIKKEAADKQRNLDSVPDDGLFL